MQRHGRRLRAKAEQEFPERVEVSAEAPSGFSASWVENTSCRALCGAAGRYPAGMPFPRNLLTDDETVVREFRPHWRLLFIPVLWVIAAIIAIVLVYQVIPPDDSTIDLITSLVIVAALIPLTVTPLIKWWFTLYVLTSERLIQRSGVVARQGIELPLENITNVLFQQNVIERLLRSGDLLIESAGESGQSRFSDIPDPEEFQSLLYRTREQRTGTGRVAAPADAATQLQKLAELHRDGVLTDEEFAAKKQALLDDI